MREERTVQGSIFDLFSPHEIGRELAAMSAWLDGAAAVVRLVAADLGIGRVRQTGRHGLSADAALRCALLKQYFQLSYEELAFLLSDSASLRAFARLPFGWSPKKSALHSAIGAIAAATFECLNRMLLARAATAKLESGAKVRFDSTVAETAIHAPTDSSLLWDAVRVIVRLLRQADVVLPALPWRDHTRLAKKRARAIEYSRGNNRQRLYRELLAKTRATLAYLHDAMARLADDPAPVAAAWRAEAEHFVPLIERIIDQTERRVLHGEKVPAADKLVSLFEPHSDIIVKSRRQVSYGHKLNLASGASGLILDIVVEQGNPADAERFVPMVDRQIAIYGRPPRQLAADGGFASTGNLAAAKNKGVEDVAFHKKCGLAITDMVKSRWVYRRLRNFRAGIEAAISCLKRAYGLGRCTWKGLEHFKSYVWAAVVAHNLAVLARLKPA